MRHFKKLFFFSPYFSPMFKSLKYLKILGLKGNAIAHIPGDAFNGLHTLHVLDLSHQELRALEEYYFSGTVDHQLGGQRV